MLDMFQPIPARLKITRNGILRAVFRVEAPHIAHARRDGHLGYEASLAVLLTPYLLISSSLDLTFSSERSGNDCL